MPLFLSWLCCLPGKYQKDDLTVTISDRFGRLINYMRISVTDRCNFRCAYCMPAEGIAWKTHEEILTFEEIQRVAQVSASLGLSRVRLTGGEPLARKNLPTLVRMLSGIPEITDISMTTNASLLERHAAELAEAGLNRVNVSLDTLDSEKFSHMTRGGRFDQVWNGILAAEAAGIAPIKINVVVVRGVNDQEIVDLARLTLEHNWQVRFIELMPVGNEQDWGSGFPQNGARYISVQEMHSQLNSLRLEPVSDGEANGPARIFRIPGAPGSIGFISPLGEHFCAFCNRMRLTADGRLRPCLLHDEEINIREALRAGEDILPYLIKAIHAKPEKHDLASSHLPENRKMAQIGG